MSKENKWKEMSFLELAATYDFTRSESNILTILAKSQKFANDERVTGLIKLLRPKSRPVGEAILRIGNPGDKARRLAKFWLKSQGYDQNGKKLK